ncbi:MAG: hypothetical protein HQ526_10980 [Actinobacteria bacterium]|nr:hypothetical protein [Actinomycetota bacterium]
MIDSRPAAPENSANPAASPNQPSRRENALWVLVATVFGAVGVLYFYRVFFSSGFARLQGDAGDGALTFGLTRHWLYVPGSELPWTQLGNFYPAPNTLGYSDTMLLTGLLAAPGALVGVASTYQVQVALILMSAIGYGFAVTFLRTIARGPWPISIIVAGIFTFGSGVFAASVHSQLITLQLLPVPAVLLAFAVRSNVAWKSRVWGLAAGLMFGAILFSAFYIGWFAMFGLSLTAIIWWLLRRLAGDSPFSVRGFLTGAWPPALGFAIMLVPFALTYLPVLKQGTGRTSDVLNRYALTPGQLLTVGQDNVLWGRILDVPKLSDGAGEVTGFTPTPFLLVTVVCLAIWALLRLSRLSRFGSLGLACVSVGLLLWVIPVRFGESFPGGALIAAMPGGTALRAISRIELMAVALLVTALALLLIEWAGNRDKPVDRKRLGIAIAICAVIAAEQVNLQAQQRLPVARINYLNAVPAAPQECDSFAITTFVPEEFSENMRSRRKARSQTDAWLVAQRLGIPTWNGRSAINPAGWGLKDPEDPGYKQAATDWAQTNGLKNGCGLSLVDRTWLNPEEFKAWLGSN